MTAEQLGRVIEGEAARPGTARRLGSFFTPSGKTGTIFSRHPLLRLERRQAEVGRALGQDLDEGEADPSACSFSAFLMALPARTRCLASKSATRST